MNDTLYEFATAVEALGVAAGEAIRAMLNRIRGAEKPIIKSFNNFCDKLAVALGNEAIKKRLRQQSIRDRRQQLERSWKRLHGMPAARKKRHRNSGQ